jgi:hypothetical protein
VTLQELGTRVNWPGTITQLFNRWRTRYKGIFLKKPSFQRIWLALPKYICWKLWLARKKILFAGESCLPTSVANKAINVLSEQFTQMKLSTNSLNSLDNMEWVWLDNLSITFSDNSPPPSHPPWQIQLSIDEYENWIKTRNNYILCFDGASKGNPGVAGAGGVLFYLGGHTDFSFA